METSLEAMGQRQPFDFLSLDPKTHVVFSDHDGTDTPFVVDAKTAFPPKSYVETLGQLLNAGFDICIITGRPIQAPRADAVGVDDFYAPLHLPASGLHGFEIRTSAGGDIQRPDIQPIDSQWWDRAEAIAKKYGAEVEPKGSSHMGFHVRRIGNDQAEQEALEAFEHEFVPFLETNTDYKIQPGHKVLEICPDGNKGAKFDKGQAIARFMALPENQGKTPVFFGDDGARIEGGKPKDGTDEYGFREVVKRGGIAVLVGAENDNPNCTSVAQYKVMTPQDLWAGMKTLADKFENGPTPNLATTLGNASKPKLDELAR